MLHRILLSSLLACASLPVVAAQKYDIDPAHTQVSFTYGHFGFSNPTGRLEKISGIFQLDTADLTQSAIQVTLPLDGLHTGVEKLDAHMKSPDFFDAAKFPEITFKSTKVQKVGDDTLKISGDLSVHGVTKSVTLDVKVNKIGDHAMKKVPAAGFDADVTLKRSDFGVGSYAPNVTDEVHVHITMETQLAKS